jgi:puromycin-sensitive aminopeptidase
MTNPYRLPTAVVPSSYRLQLRPDLDAATFSGTVEIDVDVREPVDVIVLNAIELELSPLIVRSDGAEATSTGLVADETYETATFSFDAPLAVGPATLSIEFTGVLNDKLHGFYRSTFEDAGGVTHVIATTQFEETDARRAFPCWDEPAFKATYEVTLDVPAELAAYSNTTEVSSTPIDDGYRRVRFAPSMVMSTYLVAFVVGPFEASPASTVDGTEIRVVYPVGKGRMVGWAREVAEHALHFFAEYFDIPYPGDKLDLVAIPDFAAGAMENLGLVTFRETALLIDPETSSLTERQAVASVIAHEIAHMWFGDLVTMAWWEGIWLNEAFATFMAALCTDDFRPEWQRWVTFSRGRDQALLVDGQHSTRPIEFEVNSPSECAAMFDVLTYVKGCAVLRMLQQYLGETTFRDGIRQYLARHAYGNAVTNDLWSALEAASGQPVGTIMDTWILQGGHPLVTVDGDTVSQEPFAYLPDTGDSAIGSRWKVPLFLRPLGGGDGTWQLLEERTATTGVAGVALGNARGYGFYRTAYGSEHLGQIAGRLDELDELERAVLLSDTWSSILVGRSAWADMFRLGQGLAGFDEPSAWEAVATAVRLAERIVDDEGRDELAGVVQALLAPVHARLGWEPAPGETSQAALLRPLSIQLLGTTGRDADVVAEATKRFDDLRVNGDLADAIVGITMSCGRPGDVATCDERRQRATSPQEERRYLLAPADSPDVAVVLAHLDRALDGDVRTQDAPILVATLMRNRKAGPQVWRAVTQRWDELVERFAERAHVLMVTAVATFASDPALAAEVRRFHEAHTEAAYERRVAQVLDLMDVNVAVAQRSAGTLATTLREFAR